MPQPESPADAAPPADQVQGHLACAEALRAALLALAPLLASERGAGNPAQPSQVWCVDHHFAAWPLEDLAVQQALAAWLRSPGRRLQFIGLDFDLSARQLPRFVRWRRHHAHHIDAWRPADDELPPGLRGLLVGATLWQWQETRDLQLRRITNPVQLAHFKAEIADFLQRCVAAWPVTTVGL